MANWWLLSQLKKKPLHGKHILPIGAAPFLFIYVVLSSQFGCAIGLVSGIATKAAIVLSLYSVLQIVVVMVLC